MIPKISYKPYTLNNSVNATKTKNKPSFNGILASSSGAVLCIETADLVREVKRVMNEKKIDHFETIAPDGTKIIYNNEVLWESFRFQNNKDPFFVTKYGKDDILCSARGANLQEYTVAPYLDEHRMQKGTADIILINYLPVLLNAVKYR